MHKSQQKMLKLTQICSDPKMLVPLVLRALLCVQLYKGDSSLNVRIVQAQCVHRTINMYSQVEQPWFVFVCEYCAACITFRNFFYGDTLL